ncbi:MAG: AsmA family protein, partial [Burkholderiaceae bacterium]
MMKALKWIGIAAGSLVVLLGLAVGGLYLFFDPTSLKPQIEKYVQDSKQRKLTIDGPIKLTVFPSVGVTMGKTTLSEKNAPAQFLAFDNATLSVKVLPLLSQRVEVSKVRIDGLQLAIKRDAKGVLNFDDLMSKEPAAQPSTAATPMAFDIEGVQLTNALVDIRDEKTKTVGKLSNLNFQSGRLTPGIPTDLDFSGNVLLSEPKTDAKVAIKGGFLLDQERNMVEFTKARIAVDGTAGPMSKTQLAINAGFINVDTRTDAVNAKELALDLKGDYSSPAAAGKTPATQVRELVLSLKSPQAFLSLGDQILTGDKIDLAAKGKLNNEPFDIAVKAPKLRADIPKLELVANDLDAKIIGAFGGNSANLKIAGKEVDAKLSDERVKVGGLRVEGSAKVGGNDLSKLDLRVPSLNANLAASTLTAQGIKLDAAGVYNKSDALTISLDAPNLSLASGATKSAPITGKATVKGKQNLDADFRIDGLAAAGDQWSAQSTAINYNASLEGRSSTGKLTTGFSFNPKQDVLNLSNLALDAQVKDPSLPGGAATTALKGNVSLAPRAGK